MSEKLKQTLLTLAGFVWEPARRILRNEEPALAAGGVAIVVNLLGHYNLHLSMANQTWLNTMLLAGIAFLIRQQVVPGSKLPDATNTVTYMWHILQQQIIDKAKATDVDVGKKQSSVSTPKKKATS